MNLREHFKQLPQQEQPKLTKEEKIAANNIDLVVKHNDLINATSNYKYCKNELKIICTLVADINNTYDKDFQKKAIRVRDLDFNNEDYTNNYKYLVDLCKGLMSKTFMINGSVYSWFTKLTPLSGVGIVEYEFHNDLKPFLLDLKNNFTKYHLNNILELRSVYSIKVFELLMQYKTINHRNISFSDFRNILNLPAKYRNVDIRRLLETIQEDLNQNTSITFNFTFEKLGKSFDSINFDIKDSTIKTKKS